MAEIVNEIAATAGTPWSLTPRELALIAQSKADFETGRVVTPNVYHAEMSTFLSERRAKVPQLG